MIWRVSLVTESTNFARKPPYSHLTYEGFQELRIDLKQRETAYGASLVFGTAVGFRAGICSYSEKRLSLAAFNQLSAGRNFRRFNKTRSKTSTRRRLTRRFEEGVRGLRLTCRAGPARRDYSPRAMTGTVTRDRKRRL
jgi:hypothetical protein